MAWSHLCCMEGASMRRRHRRRHGRAEPVPLWHISPLAGFRRRPAGALPIRRVQAEAAIAARPRFTCADGSASTMSPKLSPYGERTNDTEGTGHASYRLWLPGRTARPVSCHGPDGYAACFHGLPDAMPHHPNSEPGIRGLLFTARTGRPIASWLRCSAARAP